MSCEREAEIRAFLAAAGLAGARREPMAGDASTRRYERLHRDGGPSLILMDQPPSLETQPCPPEASDAERAVLGFNALYRLAAGRIEAFVACADYLRGLGLSAPEVLAADPPAGLAILEDFGDDLFARLIEAGADETTLYEAATDVLIRLRAEPPPARLGGWPLLTYDSLALSTAGSLFIEWLPRLYPSLTFAGEAEADWEAIWEPIRRRAQSEPLVFCHRDFHAENLIWLPRRAGPARVGLLDFQDAVRAPPAWDLSMLLHDARRDVSPEREAAVLARYRAACPDLDMRDFHALGALNIARILGIFARLVVRDGKPRYQALMPRLWSYLDRCLADPTPPGLAQWLDRHIPTQVRR